jgi:hypothetical protein
MKTEIEDINPKFKLTITADSLGELEHIIKADTYKALLFEIRFNFWRRWKYGTVELDLDDMREHLSNLFNEHGVNDTDFDGY